MEQVISSEKVPIKLWLNDIEDGAVEQAKNIANLPFVFKHVSIMPDSHQGYGMPIGGVMATKGVIVPNAVGVDIGCGMCAVKTNLTTLPTDKLKNIMSIIREKVPVGFNWHKEAQHSGIFSGVPKIDVIERNVEKAKKQLGTLGGGNHFIEIQKEESGAIWVMVHSGSRNIGYQVAKHYNKIAQDLCKKWYSNIPEPKGEDGLAFLPLDSNKGQEYFIAMNYALEFALENRLLMLRRIEDAFSIVLDCAFEPEINIHHNFASIENHFGQNVVVHRKGATQAKKDQLGIIPGSQGTKSYIVKGLGNQESFESCSHGAGRLMSRTKAQNNLDIEAEKKILDDQGIIHSIRNKKDLDEAPSAYKDISVVMDNQKDLVEIITELTPLAVIKG